MFLMISNGSFYTRQDVYEATHATTAKTQTSTRAQHAYATKECVHGSAGSADYISLPKCIEGVIAFDAQPMHQRLRRAQSA